VIFKTDGFSSKPVNPDFNITLDRISLSDPASTTPIARVAGRVSKQARVRVLVDNVPFGESQIDEDYFANVPFRQGRQNAITVQADTLVPWKRLLGFQLKLKLQTDLDPQQVKWPPAPSPTTTHSPLPTATSTPPPAQSVKQSGGGTKSRKVTANVSYKRVDLDIEVTLPNDDPRVVELTDGRINVQQFVQRTLYDFSINDVRVHNMFRDVTHRIVRSATATTVTASSNPKLGSSPLRSDEKIVVHPDWRPEENADDTFTLSVKDYIFESPKPPPSTWTKEGATWTGDRSDISPKDGLEAKLSQRPLEHPIFLFRLLRLSPYDVYPRWAETYVTLWLGVLAAVPMVWAIWLLKKFDISNGARTAKRYALLLIAFTMTAPTLYAINGVATQLKDSIVAWHKANPGNQILTQLSAIHIDDLRMLTAAAALAAAVVALIWLIATGIAALSGVRVWRWVQTFFAGFAGATVVCLVLMFLIASVLSLLPSNLAGLHQTMAAAFAMSSLCLLLLASLRLYRVYHDELRLPSMHVALVILFLVLALLLVVSTYPMYPALADSRVVKIYNATLGDIRIFFSLLRDLMLYTLLPVAFVMLNRERRRSNGGGMWEIGLLFFSAYVVGASSNLFLFPLPFLLSLWVYGRFVMPAHKDFTTEFVRVEAAKQKIFAAGARREKLVSVLAVPTLKDYSDVLEECKKGVIANASQLDNYDKLVENIKEHIKEKKGKIELGVGSEVMAESLLLSVGPFENDMKNGSWAVKRGAALAMPFLIFYLWEVLRREIGTPSYLMLRVLSPMIAFFVYWCVSAFFFGYFFAYIRGETGLKKGARVAAAVALCLLPVWVFSLPSLLALLLLLAQTVLFFTLLGAWFDYYIFRKTLDNEFQWKKLLKFEDIPSLTAFASVVLASIGAAMTSVLTDQTTTVITQLVNLTFQQSPIMPPS
jgi:hypothetical protein